MNQALSGTNEPLRRLSPCSFARSGPATPRQDLRWEDQSAAVQPPKDPLAQEAIVALQCRRQA